MAAPFVNCIGSTKVEYWHTADRTGWLEKQGDILGLWRPRFFVLKCATLFWFDSEAVTREVVPRGSVALSSNLDVVNADLKMKRPAFAVVTANGKEKYYIASSPQERDAWMDAIQASLRARRNQEASYEQETLAARLLLREHVAAEGAVFKERLFEWGRRIPKTRCCSLITVTAPVQPSSSIAATAPSTPSSPRETQIVLSVTLVDRKRCTALPLATSNSARAALASVLESLRHPFILPVLRCVTTVNAQGDVRVGVLRNFCKRGSLRDRLHKVSNPKLSAWEKVRNPCNLCVCEIRFTRSSRSSLRKLSYAVLANATPLHQTDQSHYDSSCPSISLLSAVGTVLHDLVVVRLRRRWLREGPERR